MCRSGNGKYLYLCRMKKKQKYYVVWAGVAPGIYDSWTDCQLQTKGYEGARFKSFDTREEAERAFSLVALRLHRPEGSRKAAAESRRRGRTTAARSGGKQPGRGRGVQRQPGPDGVPRRTRGLARSRCSTTVPSMARTTSASSWPLSTGWPC